jgi:CheY-like chemotaxis protein
MMGGDIRVESELGKGAAFTVTVLLKKDDNGPRGESPADAAGKAGKANETGGFKGYTVLLAEDVEINREIVLALLEPAQLTVDCAENGAQALEMFEAAPDRYDMIFMDLQMPEMDGYAATRAIRGLEAPGAGLVPIIAMTANVYQEDIEKCLEAGMNGHIGKPLDMNDLYSILRKYLHETGRDAP